MWNVAGRSRDHVTLASSLIIIIVCICGGAPSVAAADNNRSIHENIVGCRTWPRFLGTRLLYGSRMTEFATDFYNTDMNIKVIKCADPQALLNARSCCWHGMVNDKYSSFIVNFWKIRLFCKMLMPSKWRVMQFPENSLPLRLTISQQQSVMNQLLLFDFT